MAINSTDPHTANGAWAEERDPPCADAGGLDSIDEQGAEAPTLQEVQGMDGGPPGGADIVLELAWVLVRVQQHLGSPLEHRRKMSTHLPQASPQLPTQPCPPQLTDPQAPQAAPGLRTRRGKVLTSKAWAPSRMARRRGRPIFTPPSASASRAMNACGDTR